MENITSHTDSGTLKIVGLISLLIVSVIILLWYMNTTKPNIFKSISSSQSMEIPVQQTTQSSVPVSNTILPSLPSLSSVVSSVSSLATPTSLTNSIPVPISPASVPISSASVPISPASTPISSPATSFARIIVETTIPRLFLRNGGSDWRDRIKNNDISDANSQTWGPDAQWQDPTFAPGNEVAKQFRYFAEFWLNKNNLKEGSTTFYSPNNNGLFSFKNNGNGTYTGTFRGATSTWNANDNTTSGGEQAGLSARTYTNNNLTPPSVASYTPTQIYESRPNPPCPSGWWQNGGECLQVCSLNNQERNSDGTCICNSGGNNQNCFSSFSCIGNSCKRIATQ